MDKKEIVDALVKQGYQATLEGNLPMIKLSGKDGLAKLQVAIADLKYEGSFGCTYPNKEFAGKRSTPLVEVPVEDFFDDDDGFEDLDDNNSMLRTDLDIFSESDDGQMSFF